MDKISLEEAFGMLAEAENLSPTERARLQQDRLNRLVAYVRSHSPYFRELYSSLGDGSGLSDLPSTKKKELLASFDHWVTDPEITRTSVNAFLDDVDNSGRSFLGRYTVLTTSGTTGEPMPLVRGAYRNTIHAAMIQRRLLNGVDPQLMNPAKSRIASVIATGAFVSSYAAFERMRKQNMEHEVQGALLFQFAQTGPDRLELRYTLLEGVNDLEFRARVEKEVYKIFADCGCHEAQFAFSQDPPRVNRRGGKLKSVVKEWAGEWSE